MKKIKSITIEDNEEYLRQISKEVDIKTGGGQKEKFTFRGRNRRAKTVSQKYSASKSEVL